MEEKNIHVHIHNGEKTSVNKKTTETKTSTDSKRVKRLTHYKKYKSLLVQEFKTSSQSLSSFFISTLKVLLYSFIVLGDLLILSKKKQTTTKTTKTKTKEKNILDEGW